VSATATVSFAYDEVGNRAIELDPWGGDTGWNQNPQTQPHRYTTYERDANGSDEAMMRRYEGKWGVFAQPDPYDGSYDLTNPQSLHRYAYSQNDPVNFTDPSGLMPCEPGNYSAECGSSGFGGWGGGFDLNDRSRGGGRDTVAARELVWNISVQITQAFKYIPWYARYVGGLSWAWSYFDEEKGFLHGEVYSFSFDRYITYSGTFGTYGEWHGAYFYDAYGNRRGCPDCRGIETDWNAQLLMASPFAGALRKSMSSAVESEVESFATRQLNTLMEAAAAKGNYGLGSATYDEAMAIGESWVGPNARLMSSGEGWISADGLRAFRFPALKGSGLTQANVLRLETNAWLPSRSIVIANGHITITR
jgi:RHS repeat-associated protein